MATTESVLVGTSLKQAWDFYFEPSGWPAWVDGFGRVESAQGYPEQDGALAWSSVAAGRGSVRERVIAHEPRTLHRISFCDPESTGELDHPVRPPEGTGRGDPGARVPAGQRRPARLGHGPRLRSQPDAGVAAADPARTG